MQNRSAVYLLRVSVFAVLAQVAGKVSQGHIGQNYRLIALATGSFCSRNNMVKLQREYFLAFSAFKINLEFHELPPIVKD